MSSTITQQTIDAYDNDGAVIVRNVVPASWIERMRRAIDEVIASPSPAGRDDAVVTGRQGKFASDFFVWLVHPEFRAFAFDSPLPELVQQILRTEKVNFFHEQLLVKEPGTPIPTPWHQDLPYWPLTGWQICSVWVPFDRTTPETGVVTYVAGSHLWGKMYRPRSFGAQSPLHHQTEGMEEVPDIDARPQDYRFVTGVLEPGDVFIHHARTLHGAPGNASAGTRRRALAMRWTGDDVHFLDKPGSFMRNARYEHATRLFRLKDGDALDSELFPKVLPR